MSKGLKELKRLPKAIKDTFKDSFNIIEKELKALEIIREIVKESISDWGNVDFNINDYPLLKEVLL